ncbi:MAG: hypothetical protein HZA54_05665 [Planctomycetes bacterium]|nr:hypothetical protein [Planctomycetota bacterium]
MQPIIPSGFERADVSFGGASAEPRCEPEIGEDRIPGVIQLLNFTGSGVHLVARRPIGVRVWREDDDYFALNETLNLSAMGPTPSEAVRNFEHELVYFYRCYQGLAQTQVMGLARQLKQQFAELFVEA